MFQAENKADPKALRWANPPCVWGATSQPVRLKERRIKDSRGPGCWVPLAMMGSLNFALSDVEIHCRDLRRKVTVSLTESLQDIIALSEYFAKELRKQYCHLLRHNCGRRTVFCLFLVGRRWGVDGVIGGSSQVYFSIIAWVVSG